MAANYPSPDLTADIYNHYKSEAIVRKFTRPAMKEILGLQYRLCELLKTPHESASPPNDGTVDPANTSQAQQTSAASERHATDLSETFLLLKEYHDAILRLVGMDALEKPLELDIQNLRQSLETLGCRPGTQETNNVRWLEEKDDLIALLTNKNPRFDRLTKSVEQNLVWLNNHYLLPCLQVMDDRHVKFSAERLAKVVAVVAVIIAPLINVGSMFALFYIHGMAIRLVVILIFTSLFSAVMLFLTQANTPEIFGATAAFSAVLAVFIGTTSNA